MTMKLRNVPFSPPDMTEAEADEVRDAILSGWITTGPRTKRLEKLLAGYVGVADGGDDPKVHPSCVCLNSQTACGEMALRVLGIGPGDEVIVPSYTYTASASVVAHVGAKVVLVDVRKPADRPDDYCLQMDYDRMAEAITERTKAIIPVDLGGIPCDYDRIYRIVEAGKGLFKPANDIQNMLGRVAVCCDAAHALGAWREVSARGDAALGVGALEKRMVGAIADFSSFSFHAVKNFTTAEGGAMTWNLPFGELPVGRQQVCYGSPLPVVEGETWNQFIYRISQLFSLHGQNKDALAKTRLGAWEYDIIGPWYKCNMTDVAAAIGLIQYQRYPELLAKRKSYIGRMDKAIDAFNASQPANGCLIAHLNHYSDGAAGTACGPADAKASASFSGSGHLYLVRLLGKGREEANHVIEQMAERGIACNVHYKPLPMMTAYRAMGYDIKDFPNAFHMFENEISLPLNTRMTDDDVEYVIGNFLETVKGI